MSVLKSREKKSKIHSPEAIYPDVGSFGIKIVFLAVEAQTTDNHNDGVVPRVAEHVLCDPCVVGPVDAVDVPA